MIQTCLKTTFPNREMKEENGNSAETEFKDMCRHSVSSEMTNQHLGCLRDVGTIWSSAGVLHHRSFIPKAN